MQRKVAIVTDSTSDLGEKLLKENKIFVIPLYVIFSEQNISLKDGTDVDTEKLYQLIDQYKCLPKTAAATPGDFMVAFEDLLSKDYDIVFSGISSKMSKTYENALQIANSIDSERIFVVDSKNLSSGIGLVLLKACKLRDAGYSAAQIKAELDEKIVPNVRSQFAIETMEYLHRGGRCSGIARFFGTMLKLKPIIVVREGTMSVGKMPHGRMKVALDYLLKQIEQDHDYVDSDQIMVTHSLAFESAVYLKEELAKRFPNVTILETIAGCVISSHCGRGTIGILYILNK